MIINFFSYLISIIKKEKFELDENITFSYLISIFVEKFLSYIRFIIKFKTFKIGFIGYNSLILSSKKIRFGKNLSIQNDCIINALSKNGIKFGDNVSVQKRTIIECSGSLKNIGKGLKIDNNVGIGSNSFLGCAGGIEIGENTIIGNYVSFHSENHNYSKIDVPIRLQGVNHKGIKIGKDCWIGAKVTILDGTVLGNGCVVAAGAVLSGKEYPDYSIVAGIPAKVIKSRI